jgi:3-keto-disaccharide hydrolase
VSIKPHTRDLRSQVHQYLIVSSAALLSALLSAPSAAGPLIIEEVAKITSPDPSYSFGFPAAIGGNSIIVGGSRFAPNPEFPDQQELAAFLFERDSSGSWVFVRKLTEFRTIDDPSTFRGLGMAMNSVLAGVIFGELRVFERTAAGWMEAPANGFAQNGDIEVHSSMILVGSGGCNDGVLFQKQAGTWTRTVGFGRVVPPGTDCGDIDSDGGDVDLTGNRVIVGEGGEDEVAEAQIWNRNADGTWPVLPTAIVPLPGPLFLPNEFGSNGSFVTIEGDDAIVSSASRLSGPHLLRRSGNWALVGNLQRPDRQVFMAPTGLELLNGIAAVGYAQAFVPAEVGTPSIGVFRRNPTSGNFEHVASLVSSDGFAVSRPEISGRRIVTTGMDANGNTAVHVFELPTDFTQPTLIQDDFEDRNLAEWTQIPGSTASVLSNGLSLFYRQTSVAAEAGATRTGLDMKNQSIEADVVIRSFAPGGERWAGLTVRQTDPGNYYYLTLRNTSVLSLRKLENGVVRVLSSVTLPINLMTRHKLRLEAIGTRVRGYVDGQLRLDVRDTTHKHGTAGLRMFRTATDYDNVVISPNPQTPLFSDDFEQEPTTHEQWWFPRLGTWSQTGDGTVVFTQTSLTGGGRVTTEIDADDQAIQVRAKATQFAAGGDPWFGVVARLQDDNNFYYLTVRSSNTVSLRKLVNGQIFVLDSAEVPVGVGTWYTLRLEAIGSSLRGYVNERPLVEAKDMAFAEGTYGLATSRATARFDNVRVTQP